MKKRIIALFAAASLTLCGGVVFAAQMEAHGNSAASDSVHADVHKHHACAHCGMDREKFSHSRMLITYADGSSAGVCSIHCAVTELKSNKEKKVKSVEVADLLTKKLVDAEKATWVIGGDKKGVMTKTPKWAFASKGDALAFVKSYGGKLATYKEALALAGKE
ncbi:MAG: nitrous oxide reductase accessory protein NosL [Desulfuromonadaceae bacterium]|nr:nitrous oxide reductase accessory protein NosL [Desulfuromonadaceae bacterium]